VPTVVVEAEYPTRMEVNREDSIRVTLKQSGGGVPGNAPTIEAPGHASGVSTPIPIGTPGTKLGQALGPGYEACATAKLDAPAFKVEPPQQSCWSLDQAEITWDWILITDGAALEPGSTGEGITAGVEIQWTPIGGGRTIASELWRSRMEILVDKPLVTVGQFNLFSLVTGFIGSGLSVPWIYERWKERRGKKAPPKE
jgi:hypothetical protein